jgi:hypothetical protein
MSKLQQSWVRSQHPPDTVESEGRQMKQCWIQYKIICCQLAIHAFWRWTSNRPCCRFSFFICFFRRRPQRAKRWSSSACSWPRFRRIPILFRWEIILVNWPAYILVRWWDISMLSLSWSYCNCTAGEMSLPYYLALGLSCDDQFGLRNVSCSVADLGSGTFLTLDPGSGMDKNQDSDLESLIIRDLRNNFLG